MNKNLKEWLEITDAHLIIKKQYFHHHAFEIINSHGNIFNFVNTALNNEISISPRIKKTGDVKSRGIKADDLNVQLRKLLKDNNIDAIIGLPSNLFYSTGIPVSIIVLKKCKKHDDVLVINASEYFEKGKRQNNLLPEHIEKIVETYKYRKDEERYSRKVSLGEIEKNNFNLNISRYVSTSEDEIQIDLKAVNKNLDEINKSIKIATDKHNEFLKELGLNNI